MVNTSSSSRSESSQILPPSENEANKLFAYLAVFEAEGFSAYDADGTYNSKVIAFFNLLGQQPWMTQFHNYDPTGRADLNVGDLREVGWGLTWCMRGERFCDGHWAAVTTDGTVVGLLRRLKELVIP